MKTNDSLPPPPFRELLLFKMQEARQGRKKWLELVPWKQPPWQVSLPSHLYIVWEIIQYFWSNSVPSSRKPKIKVRQTLLAACYSKRNKHTQEGTGIWRLKGKSSKGRNRGSFQSSRHWDRVLRDKWELSNRSERRLKCHLEQWLSTFPNAATL